MSAPFATPSCSSTIIPAPAGFAYPTSCRLLRSADFRKVYEQGVRFQTPHFAAFYLRVTSPEARLGFTTPRALGKAVIRNRIKRRLREQVRLELLPVLEAQWWIVFNPRRAVVDATVADLKTSVHKLRDRLARSPAPPSSPPSEATSS